MLGFRSKPPSETKRWTGQPRRRFFGVALTATALLALALQAAMYVLVIDKTVGTFSSLGRTQLFDSRLGRLEVAILKSEVNGRLTSSNPEYYYDLARQWEAVLRREGIRYSLITDQDVANGPDQRFNVLILPRTVCLNARQKTRIREFLMQGKGVVASGAVGVRDGDGQWEGWSFFTELTGLQSPRTTRVLDTVYLTFQGRSFFSDEVPAGYTLDLPRQEITLGTAAAPDAYWSDWRNNPALPDMTPAQATVAAHHRYRGGRVAWFGVSEIALAKQASERRTFDDYLAALVRWSGRQPLAIVADWPGAHRAAALIVEEVIENAHSAQAAANLLRQEQVPATFIVSPDIARTGRPVLKSLSDAGEVAARAEHAEALEVPGVQQQAEQLRTVRLQTAGYGSVPVLGFSAPQTNLSNDSLRALEETGYEWFLDRSTPDRTTPQIVESSVAGWFRSRHSSVTRIFGTAPSDVEMVAAHDGPTPWGDQLAFEFHREFRRNLDLGGLHTLFLRSDLVGSPENLNVLRSIVSRMKQERVWLATATSIARWWSSRDKIHVESHLVNAHRIRVAVTNRGGDTVSGVNVRMYLPWRTQKIRVLPAIVGRGVPSTRLLDHDDVLQLDFAPLLPQTSYVFLIALDER